MTSILSSGVKKQKASRVFGDVVFNEADTSLSYSPSPSPYHSGKPTSRENTAPTVLFGKEAKSEKAKLVPISEDKENTSGLDSSSRLDLSTISHEKRNSLQSIRSAELSRLRAQTAQSPMRRDILQKAQEAVNNATNTVNETLQHTSYNRIESSSVNPALNAARMAKDSAHQNKKKVTKSVRFQWNDENDQAKSFYNRLEDNRRQILDIQRKLSSAHFKNKSKKEEDEKRQKLANLEKEYMFKSEVYRDHQKSLKDTRARERKKSIEAREMIRINNREGEEKMKSTLQQEDAAIYDVRHDLFRGRNETAKANADARRKSFQFRAGDAKRIRNARSEWKNDKAQLEHEDFELRRAGAKDVESYKKSMAEARRKSLQSRNEKSKQIREFEHDQYKSDLNAEHESYELKWQGEKDAEGYRKRMQEERRKSLASRNKESKRHAEVMSELRNLAQEQESESYMLKWEGERDVKDYLKQVADTRRKSLKFRGEESKRIRQYEEEQHGQEMERVHADGKLQRECQKDVENYKKECAEKSRKSLQFRGKETTMQRLGQYNEKVKQQEADHKTFQLDSLARMDVEDYMKECKRRRRKSLAFRAKEKRRHAEWRRLQKQKELQEQSRTAHFQSLDAQHSAFAEQKERAQAAVNALLSSGCSLDSNPFGDILGL